MLAMALLRSKMLDGMAIAKCFHMCISADVFTFIAIALIAAGLVLNKKLFSGEAKVDPGSSKTEDVAMDTKKQDLTITNEEKDDQAPNDTKAAAKGR